MYAPRGRAAWLGTSALLLSLGALSGCDVGARANECGAVVRALTLPKTTKPTSSNPAALTAAAEDFQAAGQRLAALEGLRPELAPIATDVATQLQTAAKELRTAARARKADRAPEYAAARTRAQEARRALTALSQRFAAICTH